MDEDLKEKVAETLDDVFGVMFSVPIKPLRDFPPGRSNHEGGTSYFEARIDVLNQGRFPAYFFFPEELAQEVARNFLDLDASGLDDQEMKEVVLAAVNVTVGGLMGKLDPAAECRVGEPVVRWVDGFAPAGFSGESCFWGYETDFGCLWMDMGGVDCFDGLAGN